MINFQKFIAAAHIIRYVHFMLETFRNRYGLLVTLIGMAVGTGNIWRFPRVMAQNGGGAFLIPWAIFLLLWSIPLLIIEFSLGKKLRFGVAGCFQKMSDGRLTWLGGFVVFCTLGIMFYYSVVTGWCVYYTFSAVTGALVHAEPQALWEQFTQKSFGPLIFHILVIGFTALVISRGIQAGIEKVNRVMIPSLWVILLFFVGYAMTLIGRKEGVGFIFHFDLSRLTSYKVWLEALTQSAWSTGAGWGLALTYACYARQKDNPVSTTMITGISNNTVEIMAVLVILPTLFTFFPLEEVLKLTEEGNTGLSFIALPGLFQKMPAGRLLAILFFVALFFAAFTSLIAMFELGVSFFHDLGFKRHRAIGIVSLTAILVGTPSAINMNFFDNQDWVWGVGLLVSGLFFTLLVRRIGGRRFAEEFVGLSSALSQKVFIFLAYWLIPLEFLALLAWWFYQAVQWDPSGWWHPLKTFSIGTCLMQWGILLLLLGWWNRRINVRISNPKTSVPPPEII